MFSSNNKLIDVHLDPWTTFFRFEECMSERTEPTRSHNVFDFVHNFAGRLPF